MMTKPLHFPITLLLFCLWSASLFSQETHDHEAQHQHDHSHQSDPSEPLKFVANQNQWNPAVKYRVNVGGINTLFMEENTFTWLFHDPVAVAKLHDQAKDQLTIPPMNCHAYKVHFAGAGQAKISGWNEQQAYHNYFLGNDPTRWAGKVPVYESVVYEDLYEGIQLIAYSQEGHFKYDFVVEAGTDPAVIQLEYEGVDELLLEDGHLKIKTSVEQVTEQKPYAYQFINGRMVEVECVYQLANNSVTFHFPEGYNNSFPLTIDPVVVAATLSGATADNWGFTATYDNSGNIFAGGIAFSNTYPSTTGAFQTDFAGGQRDIAVTKYLPDGSQQIYATYIGGVNNEQPHSMIVDFNGQLCIYGTSNSFNYPTTSNAVQNEAGGSGDIIVTKLNQDGSALVGSTFLGGEGSDGVNNITQNIYDSQRGEIVLDPQGNIYIASSSNSPDFPTTANAFQANNAGAQDAVICKLNSDLSTLFWSTYIGTTSNDAGMALRVTDAGKVIFTGIAGNADFPVGTGGFQPTWPGGNYNAFVSQLSTDGQNVEQGTFFGSDDGQNSGYFIDFDEELNVHIYGLTTGTIDITPNTYFANPGSKQYLAAFTPDLSELVYSTVIGTGPDNFSFDFVPVAFMVDKCNGIYFSAFQAGSGLPTTPDAISVGSNDFYLAKLSPNAEMLDFATYYGESYHVDGGTSRFDKAGIVYQAVCSCNGSVMNTLPNAFSQSGTNNCTIGVFKIDFEIETVTAAAYASPSTSGCVPLTIDFQYTGADAETFFWDFGTGDTSTEENPTYTFTEAGTYSVMQIVNAPNTCNAIDTFVLQIDVLDNSSTLTDTTFCPGNVSLFLDVSTANAIYQWQDGSTGATYQVNDVGVFWVDINIGNCIRRDSFIVEATSEIEVDLGADDSFCDVPSINLDASNSEAVAYLWSTGENSPIISATASGAYTVTLFDAEGCFISDTINIVFSTTPEISLSEDLILCEGQSTTLTATVTPGVGYSWQDGSTDPNFTVTTEGLYWVLADNEGCTDSDSQYVAYLELPIVDFDFTEVDCYNNSTGSITSINPTNGSDYEFLWSNDSTTADLDSIPAGIYQVTITDENDCTYETEVVVPQPDPLILLVGQQDVVCFNDRNGYITIDSVAGGAPPYLFALDGDSLTDNTIYNELDGGTYTVLAQDANDCEISVEVELYEPPQIFLSAGEDKFITLGDSVRIDGVLLPDFNQSVYWTSEEYVNCLNCIQPFGKPLYSADFVVTSTDTITGCIQRDTMLIYVQKPRNIYIPNAFSPNGDGVNDLFFPYGDVSVDQVNYFQIYDRWGELIHESKNFKIGQPKGAWDGRLKGEFLNPGVFAYVVEVRFVDGVEKRFKGDVTIFK